MISAKQSRPGGAGVTQTPHAECLFFNLVAAAVAAAAVDLGFIVILSVRSSAQSVLQRAERERLSETRSGNSGRFDAVFEGRIE